MPFPRRHQIGRTALPVLAEMEVESSDRMSNAQAIHQHMGDKRFGRLRGEISGKGPFHDGIKAECLHEAGLHGGWRQHEERPIRMKNLARMMAESQEQGPDTETARH